jgi:hypothetical protein
VAQSGPEQEYMFEPNNELNTFVFHGYQLMPQNNAVKVALATAKTKNQNLDADFCIDFTLKQVGQSQSESTFAFFNSC